VSADRYVSGGVELRCGRWQDVIADVGQVDAVITDPPYSSRTEMGFRSGSASGPTDDPIAYGSITETDAQQIAEWTCSTTARWAVVFNDHIGWGWFEAAFSARGWYTFAPVVWCKGAAAPRFAGDGPASAVEHILIARPRARLRDGDVGSRPGFYNGMRAVSGAMSNGAVVTGGKPVDLMREIIRDYTQPGDLIADLYAGGATTLRAAELEGRRCIGAEMDPATYRKAVERLQGYGPSVTKTGQTNLFYPGAA